MHYTVHGSNIIEKTGHLIYLIMMKMIPEPWDMDRKKICMRSLHHTPAVEGYTQQVHPNGPAHKGNIMPSPAPSPPLTFKERNSINDGHGQGYIMANPLPLPAKRGES